MDPITMMVASIGMQFFTQHATSKKNEEIQQKQREFQKAAAEHDFERMRRLQTESSKLALELEAEVHNERVKDINDSYDTLLDDFAHSFAIQNWPLNVLPFVMKGESFGSLINGTTKSVNTHCILTPSNCEWFNELFYDDIDLQLEAEMNNNWNAQSTHPVVYYGGGWNRRTMHHGMSVPTEINLVDIDLLKVKLKNVPVMVITPYFDPWLHFRVQLWGMGKDSDVPFRIDIPHGDDLDYSKRIFSYEYNKDKKDEISKDFIKTTIEEFVPYLESMVGFIADKYFWEMYGIVPQLPSLRTDAQNGICNFGKLYIDEYKELPLQEMSSIDKFNKAVDYVSCIENIFTNEEKNNICKYLHNKYIKDYCSQETLCMNDINLLEKIKKNIVNADYLEILQNEIDSVTEKEKIGVWFCASLNELYQKILNTQKLKGIFSEKFVWELSAWDISIGCFVDKNYLKVYTSDNVGDYAILMYDAIKKVGAYEIDLITIKMAEISKQNLFTDSDLSSEEINVIYRNKRIWLDKLIERHNELSNIISGYLLEAPLCNIMYEDLKNWSFKHAKAMESVNFVIAYDPSIAKYYIAGLTSDRQNIFATYCNTIDDSIIKNIKRNLVLTIKNK